MIRRFGDRATFAVEVGEAQSPGLRVVDLWAAGTCLTVDDNTALVSSLCLYMWSTAKEVRRREVMPRPFAGLSPEENFRRLMADDTEFGEQHWFMRWSEIVDSAPAYAYLDDDDLVIGFAFWRASHPVPDELGKVFVARMPPDDFAAIVHEAADLMNAAHIQQSDEMLKP